MSKMQDDMPDEHHRRAARLEDPPGHRPRSEDEGHVHEGVL